jgi:ABC-type branched-subunit amino acid transport system ATPase component/ABC-type branched-subunit amino acid transport system permease subunit
VPIAERPQAGSWLTRGLTNLYGGLADAGEGGTGWDASAFQRSLVRGVAIPLVLAIGYVVANQVLPEGLPLGVVLQGVVLGGLDALVAMGLVLVYRSARIINFAQAAIGGLAASTAIILVSGEHWSYYAAVPAGLAVAVATGVLVDRTVVWRLASAPRLIFTVATIGVMEVLGAAEIALPHLFSHLSATTKFHTPFKATFTVQPIVFTGDSIVALAVVPVALLGLFWFFQVTDTGVAIRAAADSAERATLLGVPVRRLSLVTWMVAAGLSGVGSILSAPILGQNVGVVSGPAELLLPLAAAVLARMESLPMTVVWAVALDVFRQGVFWSYHQDTYVDVAVFFFILVALLLQRRRASRVDDAGLGEYVAAREVRPISKQLASLPEVRAVRVGAVGLVGLLLVLAPLVLSDTWLVTLDDVLISAIIAFSVVALTGWAGQISLGQYAFVGVGAAVTGSLLVHLHLQLFLAVAIAVAVSAAVAGLLGVPALRIPGLYLAVVTLAFAAMTTTWLLSSTYFPWLDPSTVSRPLLFRRFDLNSQKEFYELCVLGLAFAAYAAHNFRRTRAGRVVLAVRDNARGASAYGISPFRAKLLAFAFSGALAGIAGALTVLSQRGIGYSGFDPNESVMVFAMAVIGGLGSLTGGALGAVFFELASHLQGAWQLFSTGAGLLFVVMVLPEGLGGFFYTVRDALVRKLEPMLAKRAARRSHAARAPEEAGADSGLDATQRAALRLGALEELEQAEASAARAEAAPPDASPPDGRPALIDVDGIDVAYGASQVLHEVSLGVAQGEIVALLGTNGAGKSTILRTLAGLLVPRRGLLRYIGRDVTRVDPVVRVRGGLVTVLGGRGIFPSLTVAENLRVGSWVAKHARKEHEFVAAATNRVLDLFPRLRERLRQRAGLLSGGEQQMLALAQALLCRPKLLLVDELSLGLAPSVVRDLLQVVKALAASGVTIVVVEQSVNVAAAVSHRAIFVERGKVRFSGPTPRLDDQPKLLRSVFLAAASRAQKRRSGSDRAAEARRNAAVAALAGGGIGATEPLRSDGLEPRSDLADVHAAPRCSSTDGRAPAQPAPEAAFAVRGVSKAYGGVAALVDVTLEVAPGEILGIIGSNGAGKTTLFDVCSGFVRPDQGRVFMFGEDVTDLAPAARARRGMGRVFQDARVFPSMTVAEALATALEQHVPVRDPLACALGVTALEASEAFVEARVEELLEAMALERYRDHFVSELSTGVRRIVELACVVAHEPRVLLLDEPTSGIAQRESEALGELLVALRAQTGAAFIVIEHDVPLVSSIADRLVCMHLGEVIAGGDPAAVLNDPAVLAAYLGTDETSEASAALHGSGSVLASSAR